MDPSTGIDMRLVLGAVLGLVLGGGVGSGVTSWRTPNTDEIRAVVADELRSNLRPLERRVEELERRGCAPPCGTARLDSSPIGEPAPIRMEVLP